MKLLMKSFNNDFDEMLIANNGEIYVNENINETTMAIMLIANNADS